jgi:hypothetical protein
LYWLPRKIPKKPEIKAIKKQVKPVKNGPSHLKSGSGD